MKKLSKSTKQKTIIYNYSNLILKKLDCQNISPIETAYWFIMKGCSSNSGTVYLSLGSFFRHIRMNYLAASLTFVAFENFI